MRRLVACLLVAAFALAPVAGLAAAPADARGAIVASVDARDGRSLDGLWARVRSLSDGRQLASANIAAGQTTFDLPVGSYMVEVVDSAGTILGTSKAVTLSEGALRADVLVPLGSQRPGTGNVFSNHKTAWLLGAGAAGAAGYAYGKIKKSKKK